jgi:hypothetical protein
MAPKKPIMVLGLLVVVVILASPSWLLGIRNATDWGARVYVSDRLSMKTGEWHEIFDEIDTRFEPGISRREVVDILLELDSSLEGNLQTDDEFRNSRGCQFSEQVSGSDEYICVDGISLFEKILIVKSVANIRYTFVYDQDMRLVRVNRPPSM